MEESSSNPLPESRLGAFCVCVCVLCNFAPGPLSHLIQKQLLSTPVLSTQQPQVNFFETILFYVELCCCFSVHRGDRSQTIPSFNSWLLNQSRRSCACFVNGAFKGSRTYSRSVWTLVASRVWTTCVSFKLPSLALWHHLPGRSISSSMCTLSGC